MENELMTAAVETAIETAAESANEMTITVMQEAAPEVAESVMETLVDAGLKTVGIGTVVVAGYEGVKHLACKIFKVDPKTVGVRATVRKVVDRFKKKPVEKISTATVEIQTQTAKTEPKTEE